MTYKVEVRNKLTKEWASTLEGEAKSRRAFIKTNHEAIDKLRLGTQFRITKE